MRGCFMLERPGFPFLFEDVLVLLFLLVEVLNTKLSLVRLNLELLEFFIDLKIAQPLLSEEDVFHWVPRLVPQNFGLELLLVADLHVYLAKFALVAHPTLLLLLLKFFVLHSLEESEVGGVFCQLDIHLLLPNRGHVVALVLLDLCKANGLLRLLLLFEEFDLKSLLLLFRAKLIHHLNVLR